MNGTELCKRIDFVLNARGQTRTPMIEALNISSGTISTWNSRGTIPAGDVCLKIAKYLNVSVEWLLTGEDSNTGSVTDPEEIYLIDCYKKFDDRDKQDLKDYLSLKMSHYSDITGKASLLG